MDEIRLVVQADDLGMCHAVNEGIERAVTEGVVTQASMMAPCPWFAEAAGVAARLDLAIGVHLTLTCEWDHLRWGPLSGRPSLYDTDRTLHRTVEAAAAAIATDDAVAECMAQVDRVRAAGLVPSYADVHMGMVDLDAYRAVCRQHRLPFAYPVIDEAFPFDSIKMLLRPDPSENLASMLRHLGSLTPGTHLVVCHPAEPGPELRAIARPGTENASWAEERRASDLAVVLAPEVRDAVEARGIVLTSVRDLQAAATAG